MAQGIVAPVVQYEVTHENLRVVSGQGATGYPHCHRSTKIALKRTTIEEAGRTGSVLGPVATRTCRNLKKVVCNTVRYYSRFRKLVDNGNSIAYCVAWEHVTNVSGRLAGVPLTVLYRYDTTAR